MGKETICEVIEGEILAPEKCDGREGCSAIAARRVGRVKTPHYTKDNRWVEPTYRVNYVDPVGCEKLVEGGHCPIGKKQNSLSVFRDGLSASGGVLELGAVIINLMTVTDLL